MPLVLTILAQPPLNQTVLTVNYGSLVFAARTLDGWIMVPSEKPIGEPLEWLEPDESEPEPAETLHAVVDHDQMCFEW